MAKLLLEPQSRHCSLVWCCWRGDVGLHGAEIGESGTSIIG
jgi:hypothetical protein